MKKDTLLSDFAADTLQGLSSHPKYLSSKYFYNDKGNTIFQEIMRMPEYYLTDCELEIFSTYKSDILDSFAIGKKPFELIELGAGDGLKTKILLSFLLQQKVDFKYIPIDISKKAVVNLVNDLKNRFQICRSKGLLLIILI